MRRILEDKALTTDSEAPLTPKEHLKALEAEALRASREYHEAVSAAAKGGSSKSFTSNGVVPLIKPAEPDSTDSTYRAPSEAMLRGVTALDEAVDEAWTAANAAQAAVMAFLRDHRTELKPDDGKDPMTRAQEAATGRRRSQLAEDLRALGIDVPRG